MGNFIELSGRTFGDWSVTRYEGLNEIRQPTWMCLCKCGNERVVVGQTLRTGSSRSCGCSKGPAIAKARTKHGHASLIKGRSRTYMTWEAMHRRCKGGNESGRKYYVANGITVCDRWVDFRNFLADMGEVPVGKSLDRYPNGRGNYEPGNCRWATPQQQTENRTSRGHVVRHAPDAELIDELRKRGYEVHRKMAASDAG